MTIQTTKFGGVPPQFRFYVATPHISTAMPSNPQGIA
jgi:hypothetical protein